jgi:hypothetical protein
VRAAITIIAGAGSQARQRAAMMRVVAGFRVRLQGVAMPMASGSLMHSPGYYDTNGRWHVGTTSGYYDNRGRWISTSVGAAPVELLVMPRDVRGRIAWMTDYIRTANSQGTLSRTELNKANRELKSISAREKSMYHGKNGELSIRNEASLNVRLDRLSDRLRINASIRGSGASLI